MNTTTMTLRDGGTVELPAGMIPCSRPQGVLVIGEQRARAYTPAGTAIYTSWSCPAYARAAEIAAERVYIGHMRARAAAFDEQAQPVVAARLRTAADRRESALALTLAAYVDDPAPCTCGG
ncbi:hypothetical protein [Streptomyces sp. YIM S03343]